MPDVVESASGPPSRALRAWTPLSRALAVTGDHWTLSIAVALAPGRMRLTHLQKCLPGISTGVLERGLQQMVAVGLLTRTRFKEMPPRVELELTDAGRELLPVATALARWGMRHVWSAPREHERADVDVLLRLLPALAGAAGLPDSDIEALVTDADPPIGYYYRIEAGRLRIDPSHGEAAGTAPAPEISDETEATPGLVATAPGLVATAPGLVATPPGRVAATRRVSAEIRGDSDAWVAALGPTGDHSRLQLSGDVPLARAVLAGLPLASLPQSADRGLSQWG